MRQIGRMLYSKLKEERLLTQTVEPASVFKSIAALSELLKLLVSSGMCTSYRLGERPPPGEEAFPLFDELDDDALQSGASIDCLITIYNPATLRASLQISNEQSRFLPDVVGPTLAALWESAGLYSTWEIFFVDPEYRPNPKDYFPTEELLQFTISQRR
jgi:hypothetical protein